MPIDGADRRRCRKSTLARAGALRGRRLGLDARRQHARPSSSGRRWCRSCSGSAGSAARRAPVAARGSSTGRRCARGAHPAFLTHRRSRSIATAAASSYVLPLAMSSGREADAIERAVTPARARAHHRRAQRAALRRPVRRWDVRDPAGDRSRRSATIADAARHRPRPRTIDLDVAARAGRHARADHARGAGSEQYVGASSAGG